MEILTLIKANIRHKKGSFFSVIILVMLISMSLTAIISLMDNNKKGIENALNQVNTGNINLFIKNQNMTQDLIQSVLDNDMVDSIDYYPAIASDKKEVNEKYDNNTWYMQKLRPEYRLLSSDMVTYADNVPPLKSGEVYIPQGICTNMKCGLGDIIRFNTIGGIFDLKIAGIIVEPSNGAAIMGWKQVFISDDDFDKIYIECKRNESEEITADYFVMKIHKADDTLSDTKFKRQLNLDTGIIDKSLGSLAKEVIIYFVGLFPGVICSILVVFIAFLMIVVLIVIGHSITMSIEMDYTSLGVLKSQGFTKDKIQMVLVLQYIIAQIIGTVLGIFPALFLTKALANIFQPITAIPAENNISLTKTMAIMLVVLLISGLFVVFATRKIGRISPVRALSGAREEIYFDSRIKAPISKKTLSSSLALRQFTSSKGQYVGIIVIAAILVFFMTTIMILGDSINSKSAVEAMGEMYTEIEVRFKEEPKEELIREIDNMIIKYSDIERKYFVTSSYLSVDGEELHCMIHKNPEDIATISKGREPLYDNEIVMTAIAAEELGLGIGDRVIVAGNNKREEYIITGLYQSTFDGGMCFAISLDGAKRIGITKIDWCGYSLSNPSQAELIKEALNNNFSNIIEVENSEGDGSDNMYNLAVNAMKAVIYVFSLLFALVVVHMVCSKTFLRERTDIGIYKALGFSSFNLRLQFAVRFLLTAIIGSTIGAILSTLLAAKILGSALRVIGISSFIMDSTPTAYIIPFILLCACFFVFAYISARKIKSVEVRELVVE